ncbi:hypothetical protein Micbo1qcDRAFT_235195 [Microdochium bolleyi]|uniref:Glucose-methanol-choline oxidoreductase N-terminal domain-containing protein n=1 Tax=Microdochium bolleyi TaxID=196109 RepID=A0A136IWU1_9PEZI|nr:hypothetical protein Micbo1qcDRAFT_235195 [Microdochium bolleyi]
MKVNVFATIAAALALQAIPVLAQALPPEVKPPPACALNCTMQYVPEACGSLSNRTCICTDQILAPKLTACVVANCTKREALATKRFSDITCQRPVNDRSQPVFVVTPVFGILALIVFGLRVLARGMIGWQSWGVDDWLMIPCVVFSIPLTVLSGLLVRYGLGKDIWMIENQDNITEILYIYFWDELLYLAIIPLTKISILAFYLRIFPRKEFRIMTYVLIVGNVLYLVVFELITVFQCTPIEGAWLHWDGEFEATCRNLNLQAWVAAAVCLVLDIATIVLPLPELWRLSMSWKKKLQVLSMFCVGFFVSLVAILRLQYLLAFGHGGNVTMDFVEIGIWSTIEVSVGIICACMPALRSLLSLAMPQVFGTTNRPTAPGASGGDFKESSAGLSSGLSHKITGGGTGAGAGAGASRDISAIKVKSEYTVRSKQRDESTFIELQPFDYGDEEDTRNMLAGKRASRTAVATAGHGSRPSIPRHNPFLRNAAAGNTTLEDYEFVVVGSGPGGGGTAANLAFAGYKVLLIDAGGDYSDNIVTQVPALSLASTEYNEIAWDFFVNHHAKPEDNARDTKMVYERADGSRYMGLNPPAGAKPLGVLYPRTGTLGGCSRHNALITMQAFDSDWNDLAALTGDNGWRASEMRRHFQKIEKVEYFPNSIVGHGSDGWLNTGFTSLLTAITDLKIVSLILAACSAMGQGGLLGGLITTVAGLAAVLSQDINGPGQMDREGVYQVPLAMRDSRRGGVLDWINEVAKATNRDGSRKYHLDIKLETLVTKVNFDQSGSVPRATGVEFMEGKSLYRADARARNVAGPKGFGSVKATREVIVAGGTYNTPQLLKLSGVGPRAELAQFDIPVLVDLPGVGTNMQDRYENTVIGQADSDFALTKDCTFNTTPDDPCLKKWKAGATKTLKGVYASNGLSVVVLKKSSVAEGGQPDLVIAGGPANFRGYFPGWSSKVLQDSVHWAWIILKAHTRNRAGTVKLRSADPRDTPEISFNYFAEGGDKDLQALREGVDLSRKMFDRLVPLDGDFTEVWPGRANTTTDAQIKSYVRDEAWGHHASCSCPIGRDGDPMAVLDSKLRVRGTTGLRVVDASAFPRIPGAFIALPLSQLAEKASADIIAANPK